MPSQWYLKSSSEMVSSIRFDRRRRNTNEFLPVDNKIMTKSKREEVQLFVSTPTIATEENTLRFEALASKMQLIHLCAEAYFQYCVTARKQYKIRPRSDGWRTITPLCRENIFPIFSWVPSRGRHNHWTSFGSSQGKKKLDGCGLEVVIPSIANAVNTSYFVISRETKRFVNQIHDHMQELRSSNELLTAERGSNSKETCALNSIKETWASFPSNLIGAGFADTKIVRHHDQDEREKDGSYHGETVRSLLLREFAQEHQPIHEGSGKKRIECWLDNKKSQCYLRAIQGHSGGIPTRPALTEYTLMPHNWKEYTFHKGMSWNSQPMSGSGIIPGGKENDKARQAVLLTPLNPFGNDPDNEKKKKKTSWWSHCSSEGTLPNLLETIKMQKKESGRSRISILSDKINCNHLLRHSARRLHLPSDFSQRRSTIIREARNTKASTQGYVKEWLARTAAAATAAAEAYARRMRE